jgi:hypothetical protein
MENRTLQEKRTLICEKRFVSLPFNIRAAIINCVNRAKADIFQIAKR